jgi:hypothetical protein
VMQGRVEPRLAAILAAMLSITDRPAEPAYGVNGDPPRSGFNAGARSAGGTGRWPAPRSMAVRALDAFAFHASTYAEK